MTACTITWIKPDNHIAGINIQKEYFQKVNNFNLLQSPRYALAQNKITGQRPKTGIIRINGQDAGILQILEIGIIKNLFHAVILDRGPLWFDDFGKPEHFQAFIIAFKREFPKRLGRRIRLIPEIEDAPEIREFLKQNGYERSNNPGYQTAWLDLTQNEETLRNNLKKKWRGSLIKAEKNTLGITWDTRGKDFKWLMKNYAHDKAAKGYDGPSVKLIHEMAKTHLTDGHMLIGTAHYKQQAIGAILLFLHSPGATYQIGWSADLGRQKGAHHLLLWQALPILKERGIRALDLGGMNDETAQGVKKFKDGLGGRILTLPGLYT